MTKEELIVVGLMLLAPILAIAGMALHSIPMILAAVLAAGSALVVALIIRRRLESARPADGRGGGDGRENPVH